MWLLTRTSNHNQISDVLVALSRVLLRMDSVHRGLFISIVLSEPSYRIVVDADRIIVWPNLLGFVIVIVVGVIIDDDSTTGCHGSWSGTGPFLVDHCALDFVGQDIDSCRIDLWCNLHWDYALGWDRPCVHVKYFLQEQWIALLLVVGPIICSLLLYDHHHHHHCLFVSSCGWTERKTTIEWIHQNDRGRWTIEAFQKKETKKYAREAFESFNHRFFLVVVGLSIDKRQPFSWKQNFRFPTLDWLLRLKTCLGLTAISYTSCRTKFAFQKRNSPIFFDAISVVLNSTTRTRSRTCTMW